jgi:hypothetical protein
VADNDVIYLVGGAPEVDLADEEEGASGYNPLSDTWISYDGGATWREERLQDGDHRNWKAYACQTRSGRFVFFRNLLTDSTTWTIPRGPATRRDAPPAAGVAAQTFFPHHPAGDPAAMPAEQTLSVALHMSPRFAHTAVLDPVKREIFVLGGHGQAAIVHRGQKQQAAGSGTAAQQQSARATHMAELQARADEQVFDDVWKLPFGDGARRWRKCAAGHQWPSPRYGASATLISGRRKGGSGARGGGGGGAVAMPAGGGYARRGGGGGGGGGGGVNSSILVIGGRGPDGKALGDVWTAEVDDGESLTWERLWPKQVDGGGGGSGGGGAAATSGGGGGGGGGAADQQGGLWPKERAHHTSLVVKRAGAAVSAAQSPTGRRQPGGRGAGDSSQLLYVMGGQGRGAGAANELGLLSDVWLSKDRGRSWAEVTKEAEFGERCGHASVAGSNGELYVIGGLLVSADAAGAEQRFDASGTVVGEMELADEAAISDPQNDVWCSSDGGKSWECRCRNAPWRARFGHAAVMVRDANGNDAICIAGGQGSEAIEAAASGAEAGSEATMRFCALGDVWRSDDGGRTWRPPAPYAANTALLLTDSGTHLFNTEHETQTRLGGAGAYAAPGEQQGWSGLGAACYTPRAVLAFASTGLYALSPNLEAGAGAVALAGGAAGGAAAVAAAAAGGGGGGMGNLADASWTLMDARSEQSPWHRVVAAVHVGYGRAVVLTELGATLVTPASPMRQRSPLLQCEYFKECKAAVYIGKNKVLAFTANFGIIELNVTSSWDTTRRRSRIRQLGARADAPLKQSGEWAGIKCAVYLRGNGTTELPGNQVLAIVDRGIRVVDTITGAVLEGGEAAAAAMVGGAAAPPAPPVASPGGSVRRLLHQVSDTVTHALGGGSHHGRGGSHHDLNAAANKHWREARVAMVHEASAEVLVFCGAQGTWRCRLTPPKPGSLAYTKAAWQATKCGTDLITGAVRGAIPLTGTVPQAPVPLPTRTVTVEKPFGTRAFHAAAGLPAPRGFHADEHSGTLVLVGGMVAGESRNDVWVSRTDGRHWDLANADSDPAGGKHFAPRCQHTLVVRKIPAAAGNPRDGRASHGGGGGGYDDGRGGGGAGAAAVQYDTFGQPIARGGQRRQQQQQQQQNSPGHSRASSRLPGGHSRGGGSTLTSHQSETTELIMIGGIAGLDATMVRCARSRSRSSFSALPLLVRPPVPILTPTSSRCRRCRRRRRRRLRRRRRRTRSSATSGSRATRASPGGSASALRSSAHATPTPPWRPRTARYLCSAASTRTRRTAAMCGARTTAAPTGTSRRSVRRAPRTAAPRTAAPPPAAATSAASAACRPAPSGRARTTRRCLCRTTTGASRSTSWVARAATARSTTSGVPRRAARPGRSALTSRRRASAAPATSARAACTRAPSRRTAPTRTARSRRRSSSWAARAGWATTTRCCPTSGARRTAAPRGSPSRTPRPSAAAARTRWPPCRATGCRCG